MTRKRARFTFKRPQGVGEEIGDYKGLGKRMPFMATAMAIFLLSLAGIPPFGGFVSKFLLFSSAVGAMPFNPWFLALAISGVLTTLAVRR